MPGWDPDSRRSRDGGVDEIPLPGSPGRLWLCGKHAIAPDVEGLLASLGATDTVCLSRRHELSERYPDYVAWLDRHRTGRALWFPIPDLTCPPLAEFLPLLRELIRRLDAGERIVVHCGAGIGRAGTTATAVAMCYGMDADQALSHVARHRPMAGPEVGTQMTLIRDLQTALASGAVVVDVPAEPGSDL